MCVGWVFVSVKPQTTDLMIFWYFPPHIMFSYYASAVFVLRSIGLHGHDQSGQIVESGSQTVLANDC